MEQRYLTIQDGKTGSTAVIGLWRYSVSQQIRRGLGLYIYSLMKN